MSNWKYIRGIANARIRGSVMLFALVISMLMVLLISSVISIHQYHSISYVYCNGLKQVHANAESAVLLALNSDISDAAKTGTVIDLYGRGTDSVYLRKWSYGVFSGFEVKARYKKVQIQRRALSAYEFADQQIFYLPDHTRSIKLSGNTEFRSRIYFPKAGYEAGYLSGTSLMGQPFVNKPLPSEDHLPELNKNLRKELNEFFEHNNPGDSLMDAQLFLASDSVINPFANKTLVVEFSGSTVLRNKVISGNIIIRSRNKIKIESSAEIKDAIILARYIEVAEKTSGSMQLFASDTILTGERCTFLYPTAFVALQQEKRNCRIFLGKENFIEGTLLGLRHPDNLHNPLTLEVAEGGTIRGQLYLEGAASLQGKIEGTVCMEKAYAHTSSSVNDNYIFNLKVNTEELPARFCGVQLFEQKKFNGSGKRSILKWIE